MWCTGCQKEVEPRLTDGSEIYPHRKDLYSKHFWIHDECGSMVGCHKLGDGTMSMGFLASPEIRKARRAIHVLLDPLWESGKIKRGKAYAYVSHRIGKVYHNGEIRTIEEARNIYQIVAQLHNELINK